MHLLEKYVKLDKYQYGFQTKNNTYSATANNSFTDLHNKKVLVHYL